MLVRDGEIDDRLKDDRRIAERQGGIEARGHRALVAISRSLALETPAEHGSEEAHDTRVLLLKDGLTRAAEAREGPIQGPVGFVDRHADVRADPKLVGHCERLCRRDQGDIRHQLGHFTGDDPAAVGLLQQRLALVGHWRRDAAAFDEPIDANALVELPDERHVHPEMLARSAHDRAYLDGVREEHRGCWVGPPGNYSHFGAPPHPANERPFVPNADEY